MNATNLVFSEDDPFKVVSVENRQEEVCIYVQSRKRFGICPNCCSTSKKVHSYYTRRLNDLPVFGKPSRIYLRSRKFYCYTDECSLKVFAERFDSHFEPYKRRTFRLEAKVMQLGLSVGGKAAERISNILSIPVSDSTILRIIAKAALPKSEAATAVGVDDWAYKKRDKYGSILVNLHTGKVLDLLPDREEGSLRKWLREHPGIKVMTRDRYSNFQKAITAEAPQALQVTDRWHLLKNLGEAVQKLMVKQYSTINTTMADLQQQDKIKESVSVHPLLKVDASHDVLDDKIRIKRFNQLKQLQGKGYSIRAMARHLGMHRQTVKKYLDMESLPRKSIGTGNVVEQYFLYIKKRMGEEPGLLLKTLWCELKEQGYPGAYSTLADALKYYNIRIRKKAVLTRKLPTRAGALFKPSTAAILFISGTDKLGFAQRKSIEGICKASETLKEAWRLSQSFRRMMVDKSGTSNLKQWIDQSIKSGISEMASFAKGLLTDYRAIENALSLNWSNGPVEGNVNRLKMIKRQMYGRAGFNYLFC